MAKKVEVYWTETALRYAERILSHVVIDNPSAARRLEDEVKKAARTLPQFPFRGRIIPELEPFNVLDYRELLVAPYRLIYRIKSQRISVIGFLDGRRDLEDILPARLLHSDVFP